MEVHRFVRRRGSHIFYTVGSQMALRVGRPLPHRMIPGTHFFQR
jgi:hypothetical protein